MAKVGEIPPGGFTTIDNIHNWLEGQQHDVIVVVAARAALRLTPNFVSLASTMSSERNSDTITILLSFRAMASTLSAGTWPDKASTDAAFDAANASDIRDGFDSDAVAYTTYASTYAAYAACVAGDGVGISVVGYATYVVAGASSAITGDDSAVVSAATTADMRAIADGLGAKALAQSPLWLDGMPKARAEQWKKLKTALRARDEDWQVWANWYEARIKGEALHQELEIARVQEPTKDDWKNAIRANAKLQTIIERFAPKPPKEQDVEPQVQGALQFRLDQSGKIDIDPFANVSDLATHPDAIDRHSECTRRTKELQEQIAPLLAGSNSLNNFSDEIDLFQQALGDSIPAIRPGLLIPRGDALRIENTANDQRGPDTDLAPLPEAIVLSLKKWVSTYNLMVGLDPVLEKADTAQLGPDARRNLIAPAEGLKFAKAAKEFGVATEDAVAALAEEAKVSPPTPDPKNRNSRRFSESIKNFVRSLVANTAIKSGKWVKENSVKTAGTALAAAAVTGAIAAGTGGALGAPGSLIAIAIYMLSQEEWLLDKFSDNPAMLSVIKQTLDFLKTLPLPRPK